MSSALEFAMNYDALPLSKRFAIKGTKDLTRNNINDNLQQHAGDDFLALSGLVKGSNYNFVDPDSGFTPLINAAIHGKVAIVRTLIDRGADIEYKEKGKFRNALMHACKKGNSDVVEHLLHRGATVNIKDKFLMTALMMAAKGGHINCVKSLMNRGASLNIGDVNGYTAIHYASRQGHKEIVEYLIDSGGAVELRDSLPGEGKTALHLASQYGRNDTITVLLDNGAKINRRTTVEKFTPLMLAAKEGHKITVSLLLGRGANANLVDLYGWSALHFTASWGRRDTAHILLVDGGANVNCRENDLGNANQNYYNKKIYFKKKKTAEEMNDGVAGGTTPLIVAVKGQQIEVVKLFLNYGADINLPEMRFGNNPIACAAELGIVDVMTVLIEYHTELNARNHLTGTTPLMLAAANGHRGAVMLLLNHLADINIVDNNSLTALDYAVNKGFSDRFLAVIPQLETRAKVNLIPWIEMECPKLDRNLECGGPSVYLNNVLFESKGLYTGLLTMPGDCDIYMVYCLAMLTAACSRSIETQPLDAPDLNIKLSQLENMLIECISARSLCNDSIFNDVFILSQLSCKEFLLRNGLKENYSIKYFSSAFFAGPLALYIESGLTKLLTVPQLAERIDRFLFCCVKDPGADVLGYGVATMALRARYCPAIMICCEAVSKALFLGIVAYYGSTLPTIRYSESRGSSGSSFAAVLLVVFTIAYWFYEIGNIEEKRWAVSPSIVFDLKELEKRRLRNSFRHFFADIWKFLDFSTLLLLSAWIICTLLGKDTEPLGNRLLATSCVPLSLGLLKYPSIFYAKFGTVVLSMFLVTQSLIEFLFIYAFTGLGFGLTLYSVFRGDVAEFSSPERCLRSLFDAVLSSYDSSLFDGRENGAFGIVISFLFLLWAIVVLFSCIIASITHNYGVTTAKAVGLQALLKCQTIQQFNLTFEKSPLCMLPVPLNLLPTALYPFHVYYSWRDRFFIDRALSMSLAGTFSDWMVALLTIVPVAVYEYFYGVFYSDRYILGKLCMCIWSPIGIVFALLCILAKLIRDPIMKRIVKSKVSDGRLRLSYGDERDAFEGSSLSNFEDERIHKSVERYNLRSKAWDQENGMLDTEIDELDDQISTGAQSEQTDDEEDTNFNKSRNSAALQRVNATSPKSKKKIQVPGPYNYNMRTLMTYSKATVYTGKNIRIQPQSPFLQLANIGALDSVHSMLSGGPMDNRDDGNNQNNKNNIVGFMRRSNHSFKDVTEWNAPMTPGSVGMGQSNNEEKHSTEEPGALLLTNGQISQYQPGLTTAKDVNNMASNLNEDEYASVKNAQTVKNIYSDDKQDRRLIDYPSIYFVSFKFAPVFTPTERKEIFKSVIPEAFVDDFTMSVRDVEAYLSVLRGKLEDIDKKQETHLPAIWKKLNESTDW